MGSDRPEVALFDLDNTLIAGDSDSLWGEFLVDCGAVESEAFAAAHRRFHEEYTRGELDIEAFLNFALRPLAEHDEASLLAWRGAFMTRCIEPILLPAAEQLLATHRQAGRHLAIVTATNRFVTAPIAERLGVETLLATEPERTSAGYTGRYTGVPTFREGKVAVVEQWLQTAGLESATCWFYSDSLNDLPLLEYVTHPVAIDPDSTLAAAAQQRGWPILTLRQGAQPVECTATAPATE
ncbi:phosphoserine phosphatase [Halorhodospira abdelmalekii]|uniref:histidinol-phosphatase n=1 Tax=Halorhodospira abdelmalekii TaxID=421629 RepID=UPI001907E2E3|nr:phosphoserine phosphatase [Halorhodospira abdelmalekii]